MQQQGDKPCKNDIYFTFMQIEVPTMRMPTGKELVRGCAYLMLLGGTTAFGILGKPAEMGLLILAAALALAFTDIERFKRLKGAGFEAEMYEQIAAVVERQTEGYSSKERELPQVSSDSIDSSTKAVLNALEHPQYTWRSLRGIVTGSKLPSKEVRALLAKLVDSGFVRRSQAKHGPIWSITEEGRNYNILDDFEDLTRTSA